MRDKLIIDNMELVDSCALRYSRMANIDDLKQVGYLALIEAVDKHLATPRPVLKNYIISCVMGKMKNYLNRFNKTLRNVKYTLNLKDEWVEILCDESHHSTQIDLNYESDALSYVLESNLDEREQQLLIDCYGLRGNAPMIQRDAGKRVGLCPSAVSKINTKSIKKLKAFYGIPTNKN